MVGLRVRHESLTFSREWRVFLKPDSWLGQEIYLAAYISVNASSCNNIISPIFFFEVTNLGYVFVCGGGNTVAEVEGKNVYCIVHVCFFHRLWDIFTRGFENQTVYDNLHNKLVR